MTGIIGAMKSEVDALKQELEGKKSEIVSGCEFVSGRLCGEDVVISQCGIGKVFAAVAAQTMILRYGADRIINTGVAGTLSDEIGVLDFAVSDAVVQHDMDTTAIGDAPGLISGINVVEIKADNALAKAAEGIIREQGSKSLCGVIASGDQFINSKEKKNFIKKQFGAIACEMEGAAIGQVCYLSGVPFVIIRCISDNASGEAELEYPRLVALAAVKSQKIVKSLLQHKG